jgi:ABC-type glutathione transport system ATPase component
MILLKVASVSRLTDGALVLQDISFSQRRLQKIAIAGETGSGKTTLLKIIAGLAQADGGEVLFENEKVNGPDDQLVPGHPAIAFLSQHFELPKFLRVEQVLTYANILSDQQANRIFEVCQIDHLTKRKTDQLSGGEKQRIAIARLLISVPKLLLLDEPFSHLDMVHKSTLKVVINDICKKLKITCILVSHDPQDTLAWADKIIVMKDGKIVQKGTPEEIYFCPVNEYAAGLFGNYTLLEPALRKMFSNGKKIDSKDKRKMIVRPEGFRITTKSTRSVRGKVTDVRFLGSHYEIEVECKKNIVTAKATSGDLSEGDTVHVSLIPSGICYLG